MLPVTISFGRDSEGFGFLFSWLYSWIKNRSARLPSKTRSNKRIHASVVISCAQNEAITCILVLFLHSFSLRKFLLTIRLSISRPTIRPGLPTTSFRLVFLRICRWFDTLTTLRKKSFVMKVICTRICNRDSYYWLSRHWKIIINLRLLFMYSILYFSWS